MEQKAKKTTKSGVDRWTSNGIGLTITKPAISKKEAVAIDKATEKGKKK